MPPGRQSRAFRRSNQSEFRRHRYIYIPPPPPFRLGSPINSSRSSVIRWFLFRPSRPAIYKHNIEHTWYACLLKYTFIWHQDTTYIECTYQLPIMRFFAGYYYRDRPKHNTLSYFFLVNRTSNRIYAFYLVHLVSKNHDFKSLNTLKFKIWT